MSRRRRGIGTLVPVAVAVVMGLVAPGPSRAQEPTPAEVVDRVMEAYGGVDAVRRVRTLRQEGMVITAAGSEHGSTVRIATCPDRLSLMVEYPNRTEIRIHDEEGSWQGPSPATLSETSGPMTGAMALQAARTCLPGSLDVYRESARIVEVQPEHVVVAVEMGPDLRLRVFVSSETGLVLRSESILSMGAMSMVFASDYADYRPVDGVMFPFREEAFASGAHTASIHLDSVEVNPEGDRMRLPLPGAFE